jgi:hypothetical protein
MKCATQRSTCGAALFLRWSFLFSLLSSSKDGVLVQSQSFACSVEDVRADDCPSTNDTVCDAGTKANCSSVSDCFDCDPCRVYDDTNCALCTTAPCLWCVSVDGYGFCSSPSFAEGIPTLCSSNGGTEFTSTCPVTTYTCTADEVLADDCIEEYKFDGKCDANVICRSGTDCYDCDPCAAYEDNCIACIAASCEFCAFNGGGPYGRCTSTIYKEANPGMCSIDGGLYPGAYTSTCLANDSSNSTGLYALLVLLPLAVGIGLFVYRRKRLPCGKAHHSAPM